MCIFSWVFARFEKSKETNEGFSNFACIAFSRLSCRREWILMLFECRKSQFSSKWSKSFSGLWCRRELDLLDFVQNFMKNRSVSKMRVFEGCPMRNARFLKSCMNFHWFSGDFSEAFLRDVSAKSTVFEGRRHLWVFLEKALRRLWETRGGGTSSIQGPQPPSWIAIKRPLECRLNVAWMNIAWMYFVARDLTRPGPLARRIRLDCS